MSALAHSDGTLPPTVRPRPQTRALADVISCFTNRLKDTHIDGGKYLPAAIAPDAGTRAALEARKRELLAGLAPDPERSKPVLATLLNLFAGYGEGVEDARFAVKGAARACQRLPAWAIEEAAGRFCEGTVSIQWNPEKRPTPPQIRAEALRGILAFEEEIYRIDRVLSATIVDTDTTEEEREKNLAMLHDLMREISGSNVVGRLPEEVVERERAAMAEANARAHERDAEARRARGMPPASLIVPRASETPPGGADGMADDDAAAAAEQEA